MEGKLSMHVKVCLVAWPILFSSHVMKLGGISFISIDKVGIVMNMYTCKL